MKLNQGLATIPLILGIVLLVIAVPVAVLLVQQNQNMANRAYEAPVAGSVDCTQIYNAKLSYCGVGYTAPSSSGVPCTELDSAISRYCIGTTPVPTRSLLGTPVPAPTSVTLCSTGQAKCIGRLLLVCSQNKWTLKQPCPDLCDNGQCVTHPPKTTTTLPPKTIAPPVNPVY